jgi:outer membrane autotransporter protein
MVIVLVSGGAGTAWGVEVNGSTNTTAGYNITGDPTGDPADADVHRRQAAQTFVGGGAAGLAAGTNTSNNRVDVLDTTSAVNFTVAGGGFVNGTAPLVNVVNNTVYITGTVGADWGNGNYSGNAIGGATNVTGSVVANNTVHLNGGQVWSQIAGGMSRSSTPSPGNIVQNNTAYITGGGRVNYDVYGGAAVNGTALGNNVTINSGIVNGSVFGGSGSSADSNFVNVTQGTVNEKVVGGKAEGWAGTPGTLSSASSNSVYITNSTAGRYAVGGFFSGLVYPVSFTNVSIRDNEITIINSTVGNFSVSSTDRGIAAGGYIEKGPANTADGVIDGNTITIGGSATRVKNVAGGYAEEFSRSNITNNYVDIDGGVYGNSTIGGYGIGRIAGGRAEGNFSGRITGNEVHFRNGQAESILGGFVSGWSTQPSNFSGLISGNSVFITGGTVTNTTAGSINESIVAGGYVTGGASGQIIDNQVFFSDARALSVYGGRTGNNASTNITGNEVTIYNGTIGNTSEAYQGYAAGASAGANNTGNVSGNTVNFQDGTAYYVIGADAGDNFTGTLSGNKANVSGGQVINTSVAVTGAGIVAGGRAGNLSTGNITGNEAVFGNSVTNYIYGGLALDGAASNVTENKVTVLSGQINQDVTGGRASTGQALRNTVNLSNAAVGGSIYGGYSNSSIASFNSVTLTDVNVTGSVYGGFSNTTGQVNTNNTVTLSGVNIGGSLIGANQAGAANNTLIFAGGANQVSGSVNNTNGDIRILAGTGSVTVNQTASARNIDIAGGTNLFRDNVTASGNLNVTGGNSTFNLVSAGGNISLAGNNAYLANVTAGAGLAFTGGIHNFNSSVNLTSASPAAARDSVLNLQGADLIFSQALVLESSSRMNIQTSSNLTAPAPGLSVQGTLDLGANDFRVTGDTTFFNGSTLAIAVSGTSQGHLFVSGTAALNNTAADTVRVNVTGSGLLNASLNIIDAGTLNINQSRLESPIYTFERDTPGTGIYASFKTADEVVADLAAAGVRVTPNDYRIAAAAAAAQRDYIASGDPRLLPFVDRLNQVIQNLNTLGQTAAAAGGSYSAVIERALREISGDLMVNAYSAVIDSALKSQGVVFRRLDRIHESLTAVPPAAGSADTFNRVWVGGFGSWARQDNKDHVYGYDFNTGGFSLGYDRRAEGLPGLRFGIAAAFSFGKIDSKSGWSSIDADTAGLGIYGSYQFDSGLFVDANFAYGHSENDAKIHTTGGGRKEGSFDINTWQLGARAGYTFDTGTLKITPTIGLRYLNLEQDHWAERIISDPLNISMANVFGKKKDHLFEIPVLVKFNGTFETSSATIIPEIRLGYTFNVQRPDNDLRVGFALAPQYAAGIKGIKTPHGTFQAGAGVKFEITDTVDIFVNYDLDAASGYINHNAALGLGFNF